MRLGNAFLKAAGGLLTLVSVVSCARTPTDLKPTAPQSSLPAVTASATVPPVTSTIALTPTASPAPTNTAVPVPTTTPMLTPTAPATISPALSVGQPVWIGHGKIVSARFLSGTKQIAIGWASGISLHAVDTGQELWFQPTPGNVIAFDVQPQEHTFAAALGDGRVMTFDASTGAPHQYQSEMKNAPWGGMLEPQRRPGFPVASLQKVV